MLLDTQPPTAPSVKASLVGAMLVLSWSRAGDDVGVDHYQLYRNGKPLVRIPADTLTTTLRRYGTGVFTLAALDAAGNRSLDSGEITVVRRARPTRLPKSIPDWSWKLLAWQQHGGRGVRPAAAPKKLPHWYDAWRSWRLQPYRLAP